MANELHFFVFFSYMQVTNSYSCPEIKDATTSAAMQCNSNKDWAWVFEVFAHCDINLVMNFNYALQVNSLCELYA